MTLEETIFYGFDYVSNNTGSILQCLIIVIFFLWALVVLWVFFDIHKRTENPISKIFAVVMAFLFIPGLVIYLLFRPSQTLQELEENKFYNKKDIILLESELTYCQHCFALNKKDYKYCIKCGVDLSFECTNCFTKADPTWAFCPYCKADIVLPQPDSFTKRVYNSISSFINRITSRIRFSFNSLKLRIQSRQEARRQARLEREQKRLEAASLEVSAEDETSDNDQPQHQNSFFNFGKKKKKKKKKKRR